jgi:hypothetical protein
VITGKFDPGVVDALAVAHLYGGRHTVNGHMFPDVPMFTVTEGDIVRMTISNRWHIAATCTGSDAIASVRLAIAEAERLAGGAPFAEQFTDPDTGTIRRIKLVTDNGGAFKGHAFAAFVASRPELLHIRTRRKSPGQNGVRERAFGCLKYEHLYRMEIETCPTCTARPRPTGRCSTTPARTRHSASTGRSRSTATRR